MKRILGGKPEGKRGIEGRILVSDVGRALKKNPEATESEEIATSSHESMGISGYCKRGRGS